jgi:hypothetical protein
VIKTNTYGPFEMWTVEVGVEQTARVVDPDELEVLVNSELGTKMPT